MTDDVINQLLLSRAIPGVNFNFIAYVEPEIPGQPPPKSSWHIIKPKILGGLRYTKNRAPSPITHSLTLSHTRFRKMSKIILFIHYNSIYSFFLDGWLFLLPLFQYVETHSTIGFARTLHKWSRIWFASSNDQCFGICTTKQCSKRIWPACCFDSQLIWKWCRWSFGLLRG